MFSKVIAFLAMSTAALALAFAPAPAQAQATLNQLPAISGTNSTDLLWLEQGTCTPGATSPGCVDRKAMLSQVLASAATLAALGQTFTPSAPTAPTSTSAFSMMGFGGVVSFTPAASGPVLVTFNAVMVDTGSGATTAAGTGIRYQIKIGTGTAPANAAAAAAGASCGSILLVLLPAAAAATGDVSSSLPTAVCVFSASAGTTYWVDLSAEAQGTASAMTFADPAFSVYGIE